MALQELSKLIGLKPEPQTTPSLSLYTQKDMAKECISEYYLTPSLRAHFKKIFERVVHRQGQGFWVQAEYGAGKTHFLASLVDLLMWRELGLWNSFRDDELKNEYVAALANVKMFPVAFSLRGMGESNEKDSLMRIFEEQIRESLNLHDPALAAQVKLTSGEIADAWYANEASSALKSAVRTFFQEEHASTPEDFRSKQGLKKFGQELVRSTIPDGRLKGKFKERFAHIYDQITKIGKYDGLVFVVDEFRAVVGVKPQYLEGKLMQDCFQHRAQMLLADLAHATYHLPLRHRIHGVDVVHPLGPFPISLMHRVDA